MISVRVGGVQHDGLREIADGLFEACQSKIDEAARVVVIGAVRIDLDRAIKSRERFLKFASGDIRSSQAIERGTEGMAAR